MGGIKDKRVERRREKKKGKGEEEEGVRRR